MPVQGKARVGHKAPDFHCDAVIAGSFEERSLDYYIEHKQWLFLLFIPAAFSFVCPTEVLAFHNTIDEFTERNCAIAFVSTDSKHSLWQWQHMPRKYGGLGKVKVPLLSDQSHQMSRDYGVLLEKRGVDLRGSYLIDPNGIVQQVTINNIDVGRSVLEALRLVEAFQAVMEKGVLCPANWKPGEDMLEEEDIFTTREEHMIRDFHEHLQIKDLDHNVSVPFTLALPSTISHNSKESSRGSSRGASAGTATQCSAGSAITPIHGASTDYNGTSGERNSQSQSTARDNGIVTLDFADPLTSAGPTSPKDFVNMDLDKDPGKRLSHQDLNSPDHGRSPSASSTTSTAAQRTVEALKRMSGLESPRVETPGGHHQKNASGGKSGYFD